MSPVFRLLDIYI